VGGPGLGKTTLLAQAIAENKLASRGTDLWIGIDRHDGDADRLARVVARAVAAAPSASASTSAGGPDDATATSTTAPDPAHVADALWQHSPVETCLVLDDVHLLKPGSTGATWLADLVAMLPANGHVVLAGRSDPPVPLARHHAEGNVLCLLEDALRFDDRELAEFAGQRGVALDRFDCTGGWPAMAELAASVERNVTGTYLWEEVLEPLGDHRRRVLAVLCDLRRADDRLASAAVGAPVELAQALAGVPLVARDRDGWYIPHALWRMAPKLALDPAESLVVRRRAVHDLAGRGRFEAAFDLVESTGLWDEAAPVLRAACLASELPSRLLGRWLASCPEPVRASPAGRLAAGLHAASATPDRSRPALQSAVDLLRAADDADGELTAIAQLGRMAWWWQDLTILFELSPRIYELHIGGRPQATGLMKLGFALASDLAGDDASVLHHLDAVAPDTLDPTSQVLSGWFRGAVELYTGHADRALALAADLAGRDIDPAMRYIVDTLDLMARWVQGEVDHVLDHTPGVIAAARTSGIAYTFSLGVHSASVVSSYVGDVATARDYLAEARASAPSPAPGRGRMSVHTAIATAALLLAEGDEPAAVAVLEEAMAGQGLDRGADRRWWRQALALSYVLLPASRAHWDAAGLRGHLSVTRDLAAAVVQCRAGESEAVLRALQVPDLSVVRASLPVRFAAELSVGLTAVGRHEGRQLLDILGPPGRAAVRLLAGGRGVQVKRVRQAKALLAAVPAPPPQVTHLGVLGPLELRRGVGSSSSGASSAVPAVPAVPAACSPIDDPDMHRLRVQSLLAFLIGHRRTTRASVCAALWPDLDERSAANNLGVNLNRLLRLLEPWRTTGEPSFYVRVDGPGLQLVTGEHLRIDIDAFDEHLALARKAETEGMPSIALDHDLAAVALYRDELYVDLPEAPWFALDREHYRTRFVRAAVRAGQLLLSRGDLDQAHAVAQRALAADRWAEDAYGVLVGGALARGDRSGARRLLQHCLATLRELGAKPSSATEQLRRRVEQQPLDDSGRRP
jgi:DNA-binding SARP family transcriptional activator